MFTSQINPLNPTTGNATTQSVRDNFQFAKQEIESLVNSRVKVNFSFGDSTPKIILTNTALKTVINASIVIETPFNGLGANLSLGDMVLNNKFINTSQNDPTISCEFSTNPNNTTNTNIILTITPGSGATQGSGFVLLDII
jgi:hypothetical protein